MRKTEHKQAEKVMKFNRIMASGPAIAAACVASDLLVAAGAQYVLNLACNIPLWVRDLDHLSRYIGIKNVLPEISRIRGMPEFHLVFYISLAVVLAVLDAVIVYKTKTSFGERYFNVGQKGVARWTTDQEIREQYREIPDRDRPFPGAGGTIVSRIGTNLYIDDSPTNNLIIGITRSGKGEMFVFPSIDVYSRAEEKTSLVVCDPKMELFKASKKTLEARGYEVHLLNLDDPLHSMGFNPLEQIKEEYLKKNYAEAELLAQAFSFSIFNPNSPTHTDAFWQDTASSLLTALILAHIQDCVEQDEIVNAERYRVYREKREAYDRLPEAEKAEALAAYARFRENGEEADAVMEKAVRYLPEGEEFRCLNENEKKITMYSIINTFSELARQRNEDNPELSALDSYFSERPPLDRAKLKYAGIEVAGDRTKGSVFASMMVKLTIFTFENIAKMTAESSIRMEDIGFGGRPMAVFLGIPDYDKSMHFLATVFIRQMTFVLEKKATRMKSGKCTRRVKVIGDEFGNLPAIEGMESIITVCLARNLSFDLYIHAYSQIKKLYGDDMETICGNCGNQIYILTNDDNTSKSFSENLGNETVVDVQRNGGKLSVSKTFLESNIEKPLLNMNQLEELKEGECVVKRVMKRRDLKGRPVRPTPIFNSIESGRRFLYRHEYLTDTFPNPDEIDLYEINQEDVSHIGHQDRVWDYRLSFELLMAKKRNRKAVLKLSDLGNREDILRLLGALLTAEEYAMVSADIPVAKLVDIISRADIRETEKKQVIGLIKLDAA